MAKNYNQPHVDLYLRGRFCRVWGWTETGDRSMGMFGYRFLIERIEPLEEGPWMFYHGWNPEGQHEEDLILDDLNKYEALEIEQAYWTETFNRSGGLTYSWHWQYMDPLLIEEYRGERE